MDRFEDIKALYAAAGAQTFLLNQLYAELFAVNPEARQRVPEILMDAAIFNQQPPTANADEDVLVDIQAQMVLSLRTFFNQVETRLQRQEAAMTQQAAE